MREISELTAAEQGELLRIVRGGQSEEHTSAPASTPRVVATSSQDLPAAVAAGRLRRDLLDAFAGSAIDLRPLRRRPRDVVALAQLLVEHARVQSQIMGMLTPEQQTKFKELRSRRGMRMHDWMQHHQMENGNAPATPGASPNEK